jgi:FKBP-type peptidyl-prolyl cis-trans isomerase 2
MSDKEDEKKSTKKDEAEIVEENGLVYVDYVGRTKEDGEIFDLTLEDVAKEEGIYNDEESYKPMLVAIGKNWLLPALEEELVGMEVGESKTVEVPPEDAAGPRDPDKIKLVSKRQLQKQGVSPRKGARVEVGRQKGIITNVLGRRVRVDFNSPLAGKTLVFDVTVKGIVSGEIDKINAVIKRRIPGLPEDKYDARIEGGTVFIELPKESRYIENVQYAEIGIARDTLKVIEEAEEVKIVITYERPEELKEEKETEEDEENEE